MRTLCVLCVLYGAQSAALKGSLGKVDAAALTQDLVQDEPPVFTATGFLFQNTSSTVVVSTAEFGKRHQWASAADHKAITDKCTHACGKGVDSSCVPECQVRLYGCLDYDRKTTEGAKEYETCEKKVIDTYTKFGEKWEATHPYLAGLMLRSKGGVSATDLDQAQDQCVSACGKGVDTSCVPECQVKMYQCLDHDRKVPEGLKKYKECEEKVLKTYRAFAADWDATHPYLLATLHHTSAKDLRLMQEKCFAGCGSSSKKSCAPRCQTQLYSCLNIGASPMEYTTCTQDAMSKIANFNKVDSDKTAAELVAVEKACTNACGLGVDAGCKPQCEVQMYGCSLEASRKDTKCTENVIKKYEKYATNWNEAHSYLLSHRGHADAETLEEIQDSCHEACGPGVDSSCVPECQVKMYTCLDHDRKVPEGEKKYKKCTAEVLSEYERFADDWDAAHPYLLATHRHVGAVELVRVADKCVEACGVGVDSSCVPECQVEMYTCLDHNRDKKEGAEKYEECERKVIEEYKEFGKKWDEKHPYGYN
jgi:hypothetical protein